MAEEMTEDAVQRGLHAAFGPLVFGSLSSTRAKLAPLIALKRGFGWRSERTRKFDEALGRFARRVDVEFPEFSRPIENLRDLMLVFADLERHHFWRWLGMLFDALESEGVIYYNRGTSKIEVR